MRVRAPTKKGLFLGTDFLAHPFVAFPFCFPLFLPSLRAETSYMARLMKLHCSPVLQELQSVPILAPTPRIFCLKKLGCTVKFGSIFFGVKMAIFDATFVGQIYSKNRRW